MNRFFLYFFFSLLLLGCKEQESPPVVITYPVKDVAAISVFAGGYIADDGGLPITSRGFAWGLVGKPNTEQHLEVPVETSAKGEFHFTISGLTPDKNYFIRAFAENEKGVVYGNTYNFTTRDGIISLNTLPVSEIGMFGAISGGEIVNDGGAEIISKGVLWKTPESYITPNLQNCSGFTEDGTGTGQFISNISGLHSNFLYQIRAYAKSSSGVFYGPILSFTTLPYPDGVRSQVTDIDGNVYPTITLGSKEWMTENLKTTKYSDSSPIPLLTGNSDWMRTNGGAYCWYVHPELNNGDEYGALYNGAAIGDNRGLCPIGWRVPSSSEWSSMFQHLVVFYGIPNVHFNYNSPANLLRSCRQIGSSFGVSCDTSIHPRWNSGTHSSPDPFGFSILPAGQRHFEGDFMGIGEYTYFWTSFASGNSHRYYVTFHQSIMLSTYYATRWYGFSVRCIRDISEPLE